MERCTFPRLALSVALVATIALARPAAADPAPAKGAAGSDAVLEGFAYATLKSTKKLSHPKWNFSVEVKAVEGNTLVAPVIEGRSPGGAVSGVMLAKEGKLRVDRGRNVLVIELRQVVGEIDDELRFDAERYVREIPLPADFGKQ